MANFDWDHLRTFIAVARSGRLTAAAMKMGSDHTTLSRRINCLEHALQAKLFERSPTGYTLTTEGVRLLALAEQMETLSILASDTIGGSASKVEGMVRIAGPEGFSSYFLAPRLAKLSDTYPGLNVQLVASSAIHSLSRRDADIVISLSRPADGRVVARKLIDYDLRLYASRAFLDQTVAINALEDLQGQKFIGYIDDLIQMPELNYRANISTSTATRLESSNLLVQVKATLAGAGICVLPTFIARCELGLEAVLPEIVQLKRSFWMIIHEDHKDRARVRIASRFIADAVHRARRLFHYEHGADAPEVMVTEVFEALHENGRMGDAELH